MPDSNSSGQILRGQIVFDDDVSAFRGATLYITLEDVTYTDERAVSVGRLVKTDVAYDPAVREPLTFEMICEVPNRNALYSVRTHVDLDDDGKISHGDYVNTQSYPVLTRGHPSEISVYVRRVK